MKIALWGYDYLGKKLSESLSRYWDRAYTVTRIYSPSFAGTPDAFWDIAVSGPEELTADYQKGLFEAVIPCIPDGLRRKALKDDLAGRGIPVMFPGDMNDFVSPQELGAEDLGREEGCGIYRLRNIMAARCSHYSGECMYIFNEEGKILIDPWTVYMWNDPDNMRIYPFRLKNPIPDKVPMPGSYCLLTKLYSNNYWHFTFQNLCDAYLLEKRGFTGKYIIGTASHNRDALAMLGIAPERIISLNALSEKKVYVFEEIIGVQTDRSSSPVANLVLAGAAKKIKSRLKRDPSYPRYIYVKRIGSRKLKNGDEFAEKYGFTTIIPEKLSVEEQMNHFYNADIVLCPHGANSTNCLYMHEHSVFMEVFSERWYMNLNAGVCRENHVYHLKVIGPAEGIAQDGMLDDYTAPEDKMEAALKAAYECIRDPKAALGVLSQAQGISATEAALKQASTILIYGAWELGRTAYERLKGQFEEKACGFAVTNMDNNPQVKEGLPVKTLSDWQRELSEKRLLPEDVTVVMALHRKFYAEVRAALQKAGFEKILPAEALEWYSLYRKENGLEET